MSTSDTLYSGADKQRENVRLALGNFISDIFSDFFDATSTDKKDSRSDLLVSGLALMALAR